MENKTEFNEVVPCCCCSLCKVVHQAGFTGSDSYLCSDRNLSEVDPMMDGCTLGVLGEPGTAVLYESVDTDPVVYGSYS